jgi:hypothetical protein
MKGYGDSGKGMQFTSAKKGAQQTAPGFDKPDQEADKKSWASRSIDSKPVRERQRNEGGTKTSIDSAYGRGANDGSKPSPRKKVW